MKAIGIIRKLDKNGRIVIPIELLKTAGINTRVKRTAAEIYIENNFVVINLKAESVKINNYKRNFDELGRIVIPSEIRNLLDIKEDTPLEFFTEENGLIYISVYHDKCVFCKESEQKKLKSFMGKQMCQDCIDMIKAMY